MLQAVPATLAVLMLVLPSCSVSGQTSPLSSGFLRASGKQIVDAEGNNVLLRGMGIGNWMLQEPYMLDLSGIVENQQQFKARLAELVGPAHTEAFYEAWLTHYFREADVRELASRGFNSIRLPMHYALFTLPADQEPVPGQHTWIETGFRRIDELSGWCASNRMYLILDMHACPGGQGRDKPISDFNPPAPSLWESAANREKLIALWREIAVRYATNHWIGGYDLINEPNWTFENKPNINGCDDQTNAPLRQLLIDLTAAVREVDTNHIIFLAGNCWGGNYAGILPPWDTNLVISFHKYWDAPNAGSLQKWVDMRNQWNMPIWMGESGENSNEWFREVIRLLEEANIGWAWWPWKKAGTIAGTVTFEKPEGYQDILDYWRNSAPRPSTNAAAAALLALAESARIENCILHPDVFDALLRPDTQGETIAFTNHSIPGRVFAVHYDLGAAGEAYFDNTTNSPANSGGRFRNDSVDIESTDDTPPSVGYSVGWLDAGDWMKYTVKAFPTGACSVRARVAANGPGGRFYIEIDGTNATRMIDVPNTGGWQDWIALPARAFTNSQAATSFKVVIVSGGFNLNWLQFDRLTPAPPGSVSASANHSRVKLDWTPVPGATRYSVKRAAAGGLYSTIAPEVSAASFEDFGITNGRAYSYVVTASNPYGESEAPEPVSVTVPVPSLSAVYTDSKLMLAWPATAASFTLHTATVLSPPVSWSPVTNAIQPANDGLAVLVSAGETARYFRLIGP